jgi:hypothetical protein
MIEGCEHGRWVRPAPVHDGKPERSVKPPRRAGDLLLAQQLGLGEAEDVVVDLAQAL